MLKHQLSLEQLIFKGVPTDIWVLDVRAKGHSICFQFLVILNKVTTKRTVFCVTMFSFFSKRQKSKLSLTCSSLLGLIPKKKKKTKETHSFLKGT